MLLRFLSFAIIIGSFPIGIYPQGSFPAFPESQEEGPQPEPVVEKVYLHLDRPNYISGEDVWYKAYLVDAMRNKLSDHSKTLYVELLSPELEVLDRKRTRLEMGTGTGDFRLHHSLPSGKYLLRAYTNWMRNFGSDFVFHREIRILNSENLDLPSASQYPFEQDTIDIQFFPEGGSLVTGVPTRVGFKAVDAAGNGCRINGYITNLEGDSIVRLESSHLGMGSFGITPLLGSQYKAVISSDKGADLSLDLPRVLEEGYVMNLKTGIMDEVQVVIKSNEKTLSKQDTLPLFLQVKTGEGNFLVQFSLSHPAQSISLKKSSIPPGIAHLVLYDTKFRPFCERLLYVDPPPVDVRIKCDKTIYSPNEKTVLTMGVKDDKLKPLEAELSAAVVDAGAFSQAASENTHIRSYLYLESELRGNIEQPGFYFNEDNTDRLEKLDLLLMTQGWRDFIWKYPSDTTFKIKYPAENGLTLTGRLLTGMGRRPMADASISLVKVRESDAYFDLTLTDEDGEFSFQDLEIMGTEQFIVSATDKKGRTRGMIFLDSIPYPEMDVDHLWNPAGISSQDSLDDYLYDEGVKKNIMDQYSLSDTIPIEEVTIKARRQIQREEHLRIYGTPDHQLEVGEHERHYRDVFELIQGKVPGVIVSGVYPEYQVIIRGISNLRGDTEPLYMLDGLPVDRDIIMNIPVPSVERVEVLKNIANTSLYGSRGANGIINVISKTSFDPVVDRPALYSINTGIRGYHEPRIFYSPRYDKPRPEDMVPDLRTTIFWAPSIRTGDNGEQEISFYNADIPGTIYVTVEGITASGIPVYSRISYRIE